MLHLVPTAADTCSFAEHRGFAAEHAWYHAAGLPARSHFPLFAAPEEAAREIEAFVRRVGGRRRLAHAA